MASPAIATMFYVSLRVTIDAPRHPHRRNARNPVHRLHGTVTFLTCEARPDVPLVCEVHEIGNIVHFYPRYRFTIFPVCGQLQDLRSFADAGYEIVTADTFTNAGDAGNRRLVRIDVAVLTRNLVVGGMYLVTEFDGLKRTAVRKIFAVHPCAYEQSDHHHKPKQGWLFRGCKRIEHRDRQMVPP